MHSNISCFSIIIYWLLLKNREIKKKKKKVKIVFSPFSLSYILIIYIVKFIKTGEFLVDQALLNLTSLSMKSVMCLK